METGTARDLAASSEFGHSRECIDKHSWHFHVAGSVLVFGGMHPGCHALLQSPLQVVGVTRRINRSHFAQM